MSDYPMLISNKLHSFRNFSLQVYNFYRTVLSEIYFIQLSLLHHLDNSSTSFQEKNGEFVYLKTDRRFVMFCDIFLYISEII